MITGKLPHTDSVASNNTSEVFDNNQRSIVASSDTPKESVCRVRLHLKSQSSMDPERMDSLVKTPEIPECSDEIMEPVFDNNESYLTIALQISGPLFVAGMCMVGAGIYLEMFQQWNVFIKVPGIIILVPALLGLKGNLEMTLASRLSTEANLGKMNESKEKWSMILGNLTLVQCQAIVVGLLASIVAIVCVVVEEHGFNPHHALLLCACSIITASIASFFLGVLTCGVVVLSTHINIDPDNVATPIAAGLGDITSLVLLSLVASFLHQIILTHEWLAVGIICCYLASLPLWIWIAKTNKYTKHVLATGWTPIIVAMLISTIGGMALDVFIKAYPSMPAFQPVINGVGGNLVSIQASRLSTSLHKRVQLGQLPPNELIFRPPWQMFASTTTHSRSSKVLISLVIPVHLIFALSIFYLKFACIPVGPIFFVMYLSAALLQVGLLLYICYVLTFYLWKKKINPDNTSIPFLTAIGDLLGIILLGLAFNLVDLIGDKRRL